MNGDVVSEKKVRGFARLSVEERRAIGRKGGVAAHALGRGHQFTTEEAKAAGSLGGRATHAKRRAAEEGGQ
jgi:hypothetical protein